MGDKQDATDEINIILNGNHSTLTSKMDKFEEFMEAMHAIENKEMLHKTKEKCFINCDAQMISMLCKYQKKKQLRYLLNDAHILQYLTSDNEMIAMKCKEDSFFYTMRSNDFESLEMLYDYWSGDLHFLGHKKEYDKFDIENLNQLNSLLKSAFNRYQEHIEIKGKLNPQNLLNVEGLIAFNVFQIDLYTKLNELKAGLITWEDEPEDIIRIQETNAIKRMILAVFDIYEKHSEKSLVENSVLILNEKADSFADTSSLLHKTSLFVMYEVYFRKLDYNFCLLILDNLHLLKLRLSMPEYSYQKIENKLYYFIYQISTKWHLYLPKRQKTEAFKILSSFKGKRCYFTFNRMDEDNESAYSIIYLERRDFEKAMNYFKQELQNRNIEENLRNSQMKLPNEDNNSLMLLPHLRDDYSLRRISQHIAQLHSIDFKYEKKYAFLFIERTLQVVGEFLKSTDESLHLQETTEALVKAEISVEIVNDLKSLRNFLCHAKNGELLKRVEVELNNTYIFDLILKELLFVKEKIDDVIKVYKPIVERDLTRNALCIIYDRKDDMPEIIAKIHYYIIDSITQLPNDFFRQIIEERYYTETWEPLGFSRSLLKEVNMLSLYSTKLKSKLNRSVENIHYNLGLKLPFYRERIEISLKIISIRIERWRQIIRILTEQNSSIDLLQYPNEEDASRIKSYYKKLVSEDDFRILSVEINELFANVEQHWKFIENLLQFIFQKTRIFNDCVEELKFNLFTYKLKQIVKHTYKHDNMEKNVIEYLDMLSEKLRTMQSKESLSTGSNVGNSEERPEFTGIKELTIKLMTPNILTQREKTLLIQALENTNCQKNSKKCLTIQLMINNIETDIAIPKKEYTKIIELTKLDKKSQKMLMNLVMGQKRNPLLPQCLSNRVSHLEEIMNQQPMNQLVLRYKLDKIFRVLLEVLLFDIFVILECNKNHPSMNKSSKLLTEINLRNILTHGSPILEVVGNVLDADDLPTELVTKAYDFVNDKKAIDALCSLDELNFDFTQINNVTQNSQHEALINEFKTSRRWRDYLKLLPEYKQTIYEKNKKIVSVDENFLELLKAVNKKDIALVQDWIDKGANVNFHDYHKKAVIHYAAMKGSVDIINVLLKNKADVNILNMENKLTALHYSAMNNFIDSVKFLLENGADCFALDDKGRSPVYWANQRNHVNVARVLVKAMKLCN